MSLGAEILKSTSRQLIFRLPGITNIGSGWPGLWRDHFPKTKQVLVRMKTKRESREGVVEDVAGEFWGPSRSSPSLERCVTQALAFVVPRKHKPAPRTQESVMSHSEAQ